MNENFKIHGLIGLEINNRQFVVAMCFEKMASIANDES